MDVFSALINLGSLGTAIAVLYFTNQQSIRMLKETHRKEKRDEIYKKLNDFYGPYQQLLETSKQLSDKLRDNKPKDWRTLIVLLNGDKLSNNDKYLFEQIMKITDQLEDLRIQHGGLVDDVDLRKLLAQAGVNFRLLKSAYKGEISGEVSRFEGFVYPRDLNKKIDDAIKILEDRLEKLGSDDVTEVLIDKAEKPGSDDTTDVLKVEAEKSGSDD